MSFIQAPSKNLLSAMVGGVITCLLLSACSGETLESTTTRVAEGSGSADSSVSENVGSAFIARLCIVNKTTSSLEVKWNNAEFRWRNQDTTAQKTPVQIEPGEKTCGAGYRFRETAQSTVPLPIDQMNVWATFTHPLDSAITFTAGAHGPTQAGPVQAGVGSSFAVSQRTYEYPVGDQRGFVLNSVNFTLDRSEDVRDKKYGPMRMFTLTVGAR